MSQRNDINNMLFVDDDLNSGYINFYRSCAELGRCALGIYKPAKRLTNLVCSFCDTNLIDDEGNVLLNYISLPTVEFFLC